MSNTDQAAQTAAWLVLTNGIGTWTVRAES